MDRLLQNLHRYCEQHTQPPSPVLYELERETHLKTLAPQMMSGRLQGQLLRLLSRLQRPQRILEIGTFTGYATICLAEGLQTKGVLHTIEANPELEYLIRKYLRKAKLEARVHLHIGRAEIIIPNLEGRFDFVFIDAGKQDYQRHYDLVIDRLRPGGLLLADNVLWSGKVIDPHNQDQDAETLKAFNDKIAADARVETLMLPLRDGLLIARKKPTETLG